MPPLTSSMSPCSTGVKTTLTKDNVANMEDFHWQQLVENGIGYSSQVCRSQDNYIKLVADKQNLANI